MAFFAGVADERRAVFAEGADSILIARCAVGSQMCLCGFVAWVCEWCRERNGLWWWQCLVSALELVEMWSWILIRFSDWLVNFGVNFKLQTSPVCLRLLNFAFNMIRDRSS